MTPLQKLKSALATTSAELDAKRLRIADIIGEMDTIDLLPVDRAEIERRVDAAIASAGKARTWPGLTTSIEGYWLGRTNTGTRSAGEPGNTFNQAALTDPFGVFARLVPDALRASLLAGIPDSGISAAERDAKREALAAELEDAEVAEEVLCRAIESVGGASVPRRSDSNPAIVVAPDHELEV